MAHAIHFSSSGGSEPFRAQRQPRVVVVDDDADTVVSLLALLAVEGFTARGAYNGHEALDIVRLFDPDAVLIDIALPDINGWEVAQRIRALRKHRRTVLIALTGKYKQAEDKVLGDVSGFNHYIHKPYDPNDLLRLLAQLPERA